MDRAYSGWTMIPNYLQNQNTTQTPNNNNSMMMMMTSPSQDHSSHFSYHQQQQLQQQQQHHHQSLASHFHLLHLIEKLAEAAESGTRDQHSDALVNELTSHFDKCQQLLNSMSGSINTKVMTVEGQKHKGEESEQLLNHRRDLIAKYRNGVEELVKSDSSR